MRKTVFIIIYLVCLLTFPISALCLEPLSEDELYDTSGQAGPEITLDNANDPNAPFEVEHNTIYDDENVIYDSTLKARSPLVTLRLSDDHIVDYFHQNVVVIEPVGDATLTLEKAYYGDQQKNGRTNYITLVWPEPVEIIVEFDKYDNFPNGVGVAVTDIMRTDATGRPLPQYYDPGLPLGVIPPNTTYVRTKPAAATVTLKNNLYYLALTDDKNGEPDWEKAERNKLLYIFESGTQRSEVIGYVYIWTHENPWEPNRN